MEALTAVSVAALTVIDMVKAVDKAAVITDVQVKEKTGGSYCEVVPLDPSALERAATALGDLVPAAVSAELAGSDRLSIPAPDGAATLTEALRRLDTAGVDLADIALRRPSLTDVFLSITGHSGSRSGDSA